MASVLSDPKNADVSVSTSPTAVVQTPAIPLLVQPAVVHTPAIPLLVQPAPVTPAVEQTSASQPATPLLVQPGRAAPLSGTEPPPAPSIVQPAPLPELAPPTAPDNTHARRNPDKPIIPARQRFRSKAKNGGELTRLKAQARSRKLQSLADDIRDIRKDIEEQLPELSARYSLSEKEIRRRIFNGAGLKSSRRVNTYNAKVRVVMKGLNDGLALGCRYTMKEAKAEIKDSPDLLDDIDETLLAEEMEKMEKEREVKRTGVRGDNIAAAVDAQNTLLRISEQIVALEARTGILGFAFFTRGNYHDITAPVAMASGNALDFCGEILKREPELINAMLELWALQRNTGAIGAPSVEKMRTLSTAMVKSGLIDVTNKANVNMNFENYVKSIVRAKHVGLIGWPSNVPFKRMGLQTITGDVRAVYKALKDGTCKWKKLTEEEEDAEEDRIARLAERGMAAAGKERKRRADRGKGHRKSGNGDSETESDDEGDTYGGEYSESDSGGAASKSKNKRSSKKASTAKPAAPAASKKAAAPKKAATSKQAPAASKKAPAASKKAPAASKKSAAPSATASKHAAPSKPRKRSAAEERAARDSILKRSAQDAADRAAAAAADNDNDDNDEHEDEQPPRKKARPTVEDLNVQKRRHTEGGGDDSDEPPAKKRKPSGTQVSPERVEKENIPPRPLPRATHSGAGSRPNTVRGPVGKPPGVRFD